MSNKGISKVVNRIIADCCEDCKERCGLCDAGGICEDVVREIGCFFLFVADKEEHEKE